MVEKKKKDAIELPDTSPEYIPPEIVEEEEEKGPVSQFADWFKKRVRIGKRRLAEVE